MKQGTVSIFFGCHSIIHSLLVIRSWKILYGEYPKAWEAGCILLHDIGHYGLDYLDDYEQKKKHWRLGAEIAGRLFKMKGYLLAAGHCANSGLPISKLYKADKYSWHIAPKWWIWINCLFEPKLAMGYSWKEATDKFKAQVKQSIESGEFRPTHSMFLERCKTDGKGTRC